MVAPIAEDAALLESIDTSSTIDLHRSNLMRMQVAELLGECQLEVENQKWATDASDYLQKLSQALAKVSVVEKGYQDRADKPVSVDVSGNLRLSVEPVGCTKSHLGWTKQSGNAQTLPTFDIMVQVPSAAFSKKDFMHYRYFDKKDVVLKKVARSLTKQSSKFGAVECVWGKGLTRSPHLRLTPLGKEKRPAKFRVHVHIGMTSSDWIQRMRLVPNRCNIKDKGARSQFYNHCLLFDAKHQFEDCHLHDLVDHRNVRDALVLIQVWALQRGLWRNHDGWTSENVAVLVVYLLRTNRLNVRMTPVQILTVVLQTWATVDWLGDEPAGDTVARHAAPRATWASKTSNARAVVVLPLPDQSETATVRKSELADLYAKQTRESPLSTDDPPTLLEAYASTEVYTLGPVFLDPTMTYNYLGGVSPNYMKTLRQHAARSLQALSSRYAFEQLFMKPTRFWNQWDMFVRVPKSSGDDWEFSARSLTETLECGLGDRLHGIRVLSTGNGDINGGDSDQFPRETVDGKQRISVRRQGSPTGADYVIFGLSIDSEASQRVVDRGPPPENHEAVKEFVRLWGSKAQLRRFKDGAIVQAAVWDEKPEVGFQNEDKWNGGLVGRIIRHLVSEHHSKQPISFSLTDMLSVVDGVRNEDNSTRPLFDPLFAHQSIMKAFEALSSLLKSGNETAQGNPSHEATGLPLPIDDIEPLSPCLRYSELFPPAPHPLLGGSSAGSKAAGAIGSDPVLIQLRFGSSSKWPTDLKAIGAAKTAMLVQLATWIDSLQNEGFDGPTFVSRAHIDVGYKGYCFRVLIRADAEIKLLQRLVSPTSTATDLLKTLTRRHLLAARHHSTIHAVHTLHPSSGTVVRLAHRWVASHLLSGHITTELIELIVARVYSNDESVLEPPGTVVAGFLGFLHLLGSHDWLREPFIVNPRGHLSDEQYDEIYRDFEKTRGVRKEGGDAMFVIAPYDVRGSAQEEDPVEPASTESTWQPSVSSPEWVVVSRAVNLAKRSSVFLRRSLGQFDEADWAAVFQETASSFKSYNVLFRVDDAFVTDASTSSTGHSFGVAVDAEGRKESAYTRSMTQRALGPKILRQKLYRNLRGSGSQESLVPVWQPLKELVTSLRGKLGVQGLFFYNELCPEVIGLVWRPGMFSATTFSVMSTEHVSPVDENWNPSTLVGRNVGDLLREIKNYSQDIITSVKIFDEGCLVHCSKRRRTTPSESHNDASSDDPSVGE